MKDYQLEEISHSKKRLSQEQIVRMNEKRYLLWIGKTNPVLEEILTTLVNTQPKDHL